MPRLHRTDALPRHKAFALLPESPEQQARRSPPKDISRQPARRPLERPRKKNFSGALRTKKIDSVRQPDSFLRHR
ncbi:MAG: hypothetical protein CW342_07460 [Thermoactinomycetaceae bacterium]|nr:hypothetical protein [Bacillota bacterium]MBO2532712.1 hypothetical protein [Thermoactinomycetaceae bacterium]